VTKPAGDYLDELIREVRAQRLTYLTRAKMGVVATACQRALSTCQGGMVIEAGCALGGSAIVLAGVKPSGTTLELYDTFEGIPAPGPEDGTDVHARYDTIQSGASLGIQGDEYYGYNEDLLGTVEVAFDRLGFPTSQNNVSFVVGDIRQTMKADGPPVAFAHIDVDWFASTQAALDALWPRLLPGGVIVVDDYGDWSGCRTAVDAFLTENETARLQPTGLGSVMIERRPVPARATSDGRRESLIQTRLRASQLRPETNAAKTAADLIAQHGVPGALERLIMVMNEAGHTGEATLLANALANGHTSQSGRQAVARRRSRNASERDNESFGAYSTLRDAVVDGSLGELAAYSGDTATAAADIAAVATPVAATDSEVVKLGVYHYGAPSFSRKSRNVGDYIQTVALMANIARWNFAEDAASADPDLATMLAELRALIPAQHLRTTSRSVELLPVARDATVAEPQDGPIWLPLFGWFMHPLHSPEFAFPPAAPFEAIPIAIHIAHEDLLDQPGNAEYLRRIGPVGCRDWASVYMCRSRDIQSFFAGCTTTTLNLLDGLKGRSGGGLLAADAPPPVLRAAGLDPEQVSQFVTQEEERVADDNFGVNLRRALNRIRMFAKADAVVTRRLHSHIPAMAVGTSSTMLFRRVADSRNVSGDLRFDGLLPLDDDGLAEMSGRLQGLYETAIASIADGLTVPEVRAKWREATGHLVEDADREVEERRLRLALPLVAGQQRATDGARSRNADDRVHLAFAFDKNLADPARVAIFSAVNNTAAPVTVHILGRDLAGTDTEAFLERLGCDFEIVDTSAVDFKGARLLPHIGSMSTMDRLKIPSLLPDLDEVTYLDVDIVVRGDVAELANCRMEADRVAARPLAIALGPLHEELKRRGEKLELDAARRLRSWLLASRVPVWATAFNAGVMVLDLNQFREDRFEDLLPAIGDFHMHDQDLLNIYAAGSVSPLPDEWNLTPGREPLNGAKLVHFIGPRKPWNTENLDGRVLWLDAAEKMEAATGFTWGSLRS